MKFCNRCFEIYRDNLNTKYCPKQNCGGIVVIVQRLGWAKEFMEGVWH